MLLLTLLLMIGLILLASHVFTDALEHLGEELKISEGVTGSIFAAVGTALPETLVPLLALFSYSHDPSLGQHISIGAILGAPLMLSTLSLPLMAVFVISKRGISGSFSPERTGLMRDVNFFVVAFLLAMIGMFIPHTLIGVRYSLAMLMVSVYVVYLVMTLRASADLVEQGHGTTAHKDLLFSCVGLRRGMALIVIQALVGLGLLVIGAKGFIYSLAHLAHDWGVPALILSLLITPIATELPEKVNSIIWIRQGKDTLAFGNISGALVFQGTLLPAIGVIATPWEMETSTLVSIILTLLAMAWLKFCLHRYPLKVWQVLLNAVLYAVYLVIIFSII